MLASCYPETSIRQYMKFVVKSNKHSFKIGGRIDLTVTCYFQESGIISFYKRRENSFRIVLHRLINGGSDPGSDPDDINIYSERNTGMDESNDTIERIKVSPDLPFSFKIEGEISQDKYGRIVFNFKEFGTIIKSKQGKFSLRVEWLTIEQPFFESDLPISKELIFDVTQ
jgi:hypothetical protein